MSEQPNLREWTRIDHALEVRVALEGGRTIQGTTRNISATGVLIDEVTDAEIGAEGEITLLLKDGEATLEIRGWGEIVRSDSNGTAFHLSALTGEESYDALRNLIIYNAAEAAGKADEEFRGHIGIKRPKA